MADELNLSPLLDPYDGPGRYLRIGAKAHGIRAALEAMIAAHESGHLAIEEIADNLLVKADAPHRRVISFTCVWVSNGKGTPDYATPFVA